MKNDNLKWKNYFRGVKNSFNPWFFIVIVFFGLLLFFSGGESSLTKIYSGEVKISFTENGFEPESINIVRGTTVLFVNNSDGDFWPASNLHPTHGVYKEFDSLKEFPASASWSFVFNKIGTWKYHNHLNYNLGGIINVVESQTSKIADSPYECDDIENLSSYQQEYCLEEYIREVAEKDGVIAGLEILAENFEKDPLFSNNCHALSHVIGEEAYAKFSLGLDFDADERTAYCGYGFYHGFMEKLLTLDNDLEKARDFCLYIDQRVMGGRGNVELACYHGIGHGFVDGAEKIAWGDERALTEPALKLCDEVAETVNEQYRCYSGVFNSLSIAYSSNLYGLTLNTKDPLWICREQKEERYKLGCYTDMMVALMTLEDDNLALASNYLKEMEEKYLDRTMFTLASLSVRQNLKVDDFSHIVETCYALPSEFKLQCIKGFAGGLMEFGEPAKEYIKGGVFCSSLGLSGIERLECYESIIDYANFTYPDDRLKKACDIIDDKFRTDRVKSQCSRVGS